MGEVYKARDTKTGSRRRDQDSAGAFVSDPTGSPAFNVKRRRSRHSITRTSAICCDSVVRLPLPDVSAPCVGTPSNSACAKRHRQPPRRAVRLHTARQESFMNSARVLFIAAVLVFSSQSVGTGPVSLSGLRARKQPRVRRRGERSARGRCQDASRTAREDPGTRWRAPYASSGGAGRPRARGRVCLLRRCPVSGRGQLRSRPHGRADRQRHHRVADRRSMANRC